MDRDTVRPATSEMLAAAHEMEAGADTADPAVLREQVRTLAQTVRVLCFGVDTYTHLTQSYRGMWERAIGRAR